MVSLPSSWPMHNGNGILVPMVIKYGLTTIERATGMAPVVIEYGLTTVERATGMAPVVIEYGLTTVEQVWLR
jgi:hypothetical protein